MKDHRIVQQMPKADETPSREYTCKFCGAPSGKDPSEQDMPPDYCHPEDHQGVGE